MTSAQTRDFLLRDGSDRMKGCKKKARVFTIPPLNKKYVKLNFGKIVAICRQARITEDYHVRVSPREM